MTTPAPVTDERLGELIEHSRINADQTPWHMAAKRHRDIETALSELQQLRKLVTRALPDLEWASAQADQEFSSTLEDKDIVEDIRQYINSCPPE